MLDRVNIEHRPMRCPHTFFSLDGTSMNSSCRTQRRYTIGSRGLGSMCDTARFVDENASVGPMPKKKHDGFVGKKNDAEEETRRFLTEKEHSRIGTMLYQVYLVRITLGWVVIDRSFTRIAQ